MITDDKENYGQAQITFLLFLKNTLNELSEKKKKSLLSLYKVKRQS